MAYIIELVSYKTDWLLDASLQKNRQQQTTSRLLKEIHRRGRASLLISVKAKVSKAEHQTLSTSFDKMHCRVRWYYLWNSPSAMTFCCQPCVACPLYTVTGDTEPTSRGATISCSEAPKLTSLRCHVIQTGNHEAAMRYAGYDRADESVKHVPGANQKSRITKAAWVGRSVVTYTKYGST